MNERLLDICIKAGINTWPFNEGGYISLDESELVKFADMIIKECLNQVQEQYQPVLEDTEMMKEPLWDGYVQCGVDSYVAIREHFYGEYGEEE